MYLDLNNLSVSIYVNSKTAAPAIIYLAHLIESSVAFFRTLKTQKYSFCRLSHPDRKSTIWKLCNDLVYFTMAQKQERAVTGEERTSILCGQEELIKPVNTA